MKVVITGSSGQDGIFLTSKILNSTNAKIYCLTRNRESFEKNKLIYLNKDIDFSRLEVFSLDYQNKNEVFKFFGDVKPDYVFNLMGPSSVSKFIDEPEKMKNITIKAFNNITNTLIETNNFCNFYQASSSEMFGYESDNPFNELSIFKPNTTYAKTKYILHKKSIEFQRTYNWKIISGIMFNHESEFRTTNFLIMKLIDNAIENQLGKNKKIEIPSLDISRDWSYAKDICDGIFNLTFNNFFGSYVLGSGKITSLKDISKYIYEKLNLNYLDFITINKNKLRSGEPLKVMSNPEKIKNDIGWKTKLNIYETIDKMFSYKLNDKN